MGDGTQRKLGDAAAVCKYFEYHTKSSIVCEGPVPDTNTRIIFRNPQQKKLHYEIFCCAKCEYCEMYQAAEEKYREE